jgi:hypothetical protein
MPIALIAVLIGGTALVGGAGIFAYEAGQQTGKGASDALTIVGIGAAVALVLYAVNLSRKK